jgi:nucleotide-binding universal stress UspA family protein
VPLDGSRRAERALRYAEALPARRLRIVAVEPIELSAAKDRWAKDDPSPWGTWPTDDVRAYLELIAMPAHARGWTVEIVLEQGEPGPRIVDAARNSDLIVMSTRGHGLTKRLIGTTADYVATHSGVPSLLVRDEHPSVVAILRVVVPLDGSESAEEAAPLAALLCTGLGADLHLVSVVDPSTSIRSTEELVDETNAYLDIQRFRLETAPVAMSTEVRVGSPADELIALLTPGDLVLMAVPGGTRRVLGGVSTTLVDRAPVPVSVLSTTPGKPLRMFERAGERIAAHD